MTKESADLERQAAADADLFNQYRAALQQKPDDIRLLHSFCVTFEHRFIDEIEEVLAMRLSAPQSSPLVRADERQLLVYIRERQGRRRLGLSCSNAGGLDDLFFRFTTAELVDLRRAMIDLLRQKPDFYHAAATLADTFAAEGDFVQAERVLSQLRKWPLNVVGTASSFDPGFHATLGAALEQAVAHRLPPVRWLREFETPPRHCVFVSGDHKYFERYGADLVASFRFYAQGTGLALHVMDMTEAEGEALRNRLMNLDCPWALSTESTGLRSAETTKAAREYYHAIRFARLWQLLEKYPQSAVWLVDMDTLFNGPLTALFAVLQDADLGLYLLPARIEIRNKVSAHMVGIGATRLGREFLRRVAGYLAAYRAMNRLPWGVDQVALYTVLVVLAAQQPGLKVVPVPVAISDGSYSDGRVLWAAKCPPESPDYERVLQKRQEWSLAMGAGSP